MTTFHDPPPQSRRAARQSERAHASDQSPTVDGFTTFPSQDPTTNDEAPAQNPVQAQPQAPAPSLPTAPPAQTNPTPAAPPASPSSGPLAAESYRTAPPPAAPAQSAFAPAPRNTGAPSQARPESVVPSAAGFPDKTLTRREIRELRAQQEAMQQQAPAAVAPQASMPSATLAPAPEAAAPTAPPAEAAPAEAPAAVVPTLETPAPSVPTPTFSAPVANPHADSVPQYPYSGQAAQAPAAPAAAPAAPAAPAPQAQLYIEPPSLIDPLSVAPETAVGEAAQEDALTAFEALLASADGTPNVPSETNSPQSPLVGLEPNSTSHQPAPTSEVSAPTAPKAESLQAGPSIEGLLGLTPEVETQDSPTPSTANSTNLSNARAEFDELARKRLDAEVLPAVNSPAPTQPDSSTDSAALVTPSPAQNPVQPEAPLTVARASSMPAGHWSEQAKIDDDNDSVVARTIGSGSSATSALVLPAIPFATDIRGPLTSGGETMLTGSIDLPSTLSASGVSDRFDHADIDSLLDLNDSDMVSTDSAPVRAVKAVSTFSNQSVTQTQKPKGTRALTVLMISAVSMSVVVAGLLVAAFVFNML